MLKREFNNLKLGTKLYGVSAGSWRLRDDVGTYTECTEVSCLSFRNRNPNIKGAYNCYFCKGYGRYLKEYRFPYYEIKEVKALDIKLSGYIKTDSDPGYDGGSWGDYAEASETWEPYKPPRFYCYSYDTRSASHTGFTWKQIDKQTFTALLYKSFKLI